MFLFVFCNVYYYYYFKIAYRSKSSTNPSNCWNSSSLCGLLRWFSLFFFLLDDDTRCNFTISAVRNSATCRSTQSLGITLESGTTIFRNTFAKGEILKYVPRTFFRISLNKLTPRLPTVPKMKPETTDANQSLMNQILIAKGIIVAHHVIVMMSTCC